MNCLPIFLLISCAALTVASEQHGRKLQQYYNTTIPGTRPVSATLADLVNDPTGRAHLLAALGYPEAYVSKYDYTPETTNNYGGTYNADPTIDPTIGQAAAGAQNGSFRVVGNSGSIAVHMLPFQNDLILFFQRPDNQNASGDNPYLSVYNGTQQEIAALYNTTDNTFKPFHITEHPFCGVHTLLPNGFGAVIGGDNLNLNAPFLTVGFQSIRVMNPYNQSYSVVNEMQQPRWYPSVGMLASGDLLILGGMQQEAGGWATDKLPSSSMSPMVKCSSNAGGSLADPGYDNPTFTIFNSTTFALTTPLALTILLETWPINSYPYAILLPTGSMLIIAGTQMEALFFTANGATADDAVGPLPNLPVPVSYPQYGSAALLPLQPPNYEAQVLLAGGSSEFCANPESPALAQSFLVDVTPGANHNIVTESLTYPRVMADLVLLPDGRSFLCNGAQLGIAGGVGTGTGAATNGTTVAEIYDPSKPIGQRWKAVADSKIWRLYHSVAFLTNNAEVFIAGSEVTAEHRVQLYTPDYLYTNKPRPVITSAPYNWTYNTPYTINFSNVTSVDRVVLNRLAGSTHGNHPDQRQVVLACNGGSASTSCTSPPNSSVAPPGTYQLFVLSQGVPSVAPYVSLQFSVSNGATQAAG